MKSENDQIIVKKRLQYLPLYFLFSVVFLLLGLLVFLLPRLQESFDFIGPFTAQGEIFYMVMGGIGIVFFSFCAAYMVFMLLSPPAAVIIVDDGIVDFVTAGYGVRLIEWDNIESIKIYGKRSNPFLGITLKDISYILDSDECKNCVKAEITRNVDADLPTVILKQSELFFRVNKLADIIASHIKEADTDSDENTRAFNNKIFGITSTPAPVSGDTNRFDRDRILGVDSEKDSEAAVESSDDDSDVKILPGRSSGFVHSNNDSTPVTSSVADKKAKEPKPTKTVEEDEAEKERLAIKAILDEYRIKIEYKDDSNKPGGTNKNE